MQGAAGGTQLTYLPFLIAALARVLETTRSATLFDTERNVVIRHARAHGVATQDAATA